MQNKSKKISEIFISRNKIYLAIIFLLLVVICAENKYMIIPAILLFLIIAIYSYYTNNKKKSEIDETIQDLTLTLDSAAKTSLINSPFPLIIMENDGTIIWKSSKFTTEFANIDINTYIDDISLDIKDIIQKDTEKSNKKDIIKQLKN